MAVMAVPAVAQRAVLALLQSALPLQTQAVAAVGEVLAATAAQLPELAPLA
jgi:hypothetical protein